MEVDLCWFLLASVWEVDLLLPPPPLLLVVHHLLLPLLQQLLLVDWVVDSDGEDSVVELMLSGVGRYFVKI
jgi:hypothetical protein